MLTGCYHFHVSGLLGWLELKCPFLFFLATMSGRGTGLKEMVTGAKIVEPRLKKAHSSTVAAGLNLVVAPILVMCSFELPFPFK